MYYWSRGESNSCPKKCQTRYTTRHSLLKVTLNKSTNNFNQGVRLCLKLTSKRIKEVNSNLIVDKLIKYRWNVISPSRSLNQAARARGCALSLALNVYMF